MLVIKLWLSVRLGVDAKQAEWEVGCTAHTLRRISHEMVTRRFVSMN
jgi:hypothetical protein